MSRWATSSKLASDSKSPAATGGFGQGFLERCVIAALLLACAIATSKSLADPDLWGHVQYGRDLWNAGLPDTATYSYTADEHRWINHEHLAELALAFGSQYFGGGGLLVLKSLLAVAVIYRLLQRAQRFGASRTTIFLVLLLTAANLMHFWSLRPQLFTFLGFFLLLELLDAEPSGADEAGMDHRRGHRIWLAFPLMLFWANAHGGFLIGLIVAITFLGGRWLQLVARPQATATQKVRCCGLAALKWGGVLAAMFAATLLNAYGFGLYRWLLGSLGQPRPEIVEWLPPGIFTIAWLPFWLAAGLGCIAWLCSRQPRDLSQGLVLALLLYAAASHRRHIALFALAFGFWITPHLDDLLRRMGAGCDESPLDASLAPRHAAAGRPAVARRLRRLDVGLGDAELSHPGAAGRLSGDRVAIHGGSWRAWSPGVAIQMGAVLAGGFRFATGEPSAEACLRRPFSDVLSARSREHVFRFCAGRQPSDRA